MKSTKRILLASAAVAVMGFGIAAPAQAFDAVNWRWEKDVNELVDINTNVNIDIAPTGMVEVEKIQVQVGDVTASSVVNGIDNNPPGVSEEGTFDVTETFFINTQYAQIPGDPTAVTSENFSSDGGLLTATFVDGDINESDVGNFDTAIENVGVIGSNGLGLVLSVTGEIPFAQLEGVNDAVDLPEIESLATAVGNNQSISSSVSVTLHDGQFLFGGFGDGEQASTNSDLAPVLGEIGLAAAAELENTHTEGAAALTLAGILGLIQPATISADSQVYDITNASIESAATAVGNNLSVDLEAITMDDAFLVADVTQFSYADVSASSLVQDISVNNYANLGVLEAPLVSSTATAVGNNVSISVSSPLPF
jgi:hypothetical protein